MGLKIKSIFTNVFKKVLTNLIVNERNWILVPLYKRVIKEVLGDGRIKRISYCKSEKYTILAIHPEKFRDDPRILATDQSLEYYKYQLFGSRSLIK